jgi:hypothetical protein
VREQQTILEEFRSLPPVEPRDLVGLWKGRGIPSGHPFDGVLENLGWFGKRFTPDMRADALLFRSGEHRLVAVDPRWIGTTDPDQLLADCIEEARHRFELK